MALSRTDHFQSKQCGKHLRQMHIDHTGGAGFIGSHLVRHFVLQYPHYQIVNVDALTYAGNLRNLEDIQEAANYQFLKADITNDEELAEVFDAYEISDVVHCAAESHVDRSILEPLQFVKTNVLGTVKLLLCAFEAWKENLPEHVFYHVSTDEVYGALGDEGYFKESTPYDPRSPYAASKASSDHFVRAYYHTYGMRVVISNCSNNYGPYQFPEKLIPLMIHNILNKKPLPVYGKGENVRDWLFVGEHVEAIDLIFHQGDPGQTYNIGGDNEWKNIDLVHKLCDIVDEETGRPHGASRALITFVKDRAGHDHRYAIDATKVRNALGWKPLKSFDKGLRESVRWYLDHQQWVEEVISGEYRQYYQKQYELR